MNPYNILVFDDEEFMRKLCGRVLSGMGYEAVSRFEAAVRAKLLREPSAADHV